MARDVFELLRSCNAWIDPNLVALVGDNKNGGGGGSGDTEELEYNNGKKKRKRRSVDGRKGSVGGEAGEGVGTDEVGQEEEYDDGEFASIGTNRIVLQRASHVSDASESDADDDDDDDVSGMDVDDGE